MTHRICIFGNSHLAALRNAYLAKPNRWPQLEPHWVGAHKSALVASEFVGDKLIPVSEQAKSSLEKLGNPGGVDLAPFDSFAIVGGRTAFINVAALQRDLRFVGLPSLQSEPDLARMEPRLVSRSAFLEMAVESLNNTVAVKFTRNLRSYTDRPILWLHQQHTGKGALKDPAPIYNHLRRLHETGDAEAMVGVYLDACSQIAKDLKLTFVKQPGPTIIDHIFTKQWFSTGSVRLTEKGRYKHDKDDFDHANDRFGAKALTNIQKFLDRLAKAASKRA
jgi:hypothetical protein